MKTTFFVPDIANHVPHMDIAWDAAKISLTPHEMTKLLSESRPSIVLTSGEERPGLSMNSFMLQPGEHKIVADQLVKILRAHAA